MKTNFSFFGYDNSVQTTEYCIKTSKLPNSFNGFKIAHISDSHSQPAKGICDAIDSQNPDIIVITGDMLHDDDKPFDDFTKMLSELLKIAPVYLITGNHDVWRYNHKAIINQFCDLGAVLLDNKMVEIEKNNDKIALFGVDDPFSRIPSIISQNTKSSISMLPEFDGYKILLFHRANLFDEIKDYDFDLILSGHMHGGQIQIPKLGGMLAPSSAILSKRSMIFPKYCSGKFEYKDTTMIVNRGISNTMIIPRFFNRPEVCIITLSK